jgi:hypothetical protein
MKSLIPPLTALTLLLVANGDKFVALSAAALLAICLAKR